MNSIARLPNKDREALFRNTSQKINLSEAIVEKDFWVCWILDYLFHKCKWQNNLAFKGGTSLSKSYGIIKRFSEDIDLILDWRILGYRKDEPLQERSKTKQDSFNKDANRKTAEFLKFEFLDEIVKDVSKTLQHPVQFQIGAEDTQTVKFIYPQSFSDSAILPEIKLEIGVLAAWTPSVNLNIHPYAANQYPILFKQPDTLIRTVSAERTFWEKVTILHREANRPNGVIPSRYSRHYFDLYCMALSEVKGNAFLDIALLEKVVAFKDKFYHCSWAKYEDAHPGTMKLLPPARSMNELNKDYQHMQNMIFGEIPTFDVMMETIKNLEDEINTI